MATQFLSPSLNWVKPNKLFMLILSCLLGLGGFGLNPQGAIAAMAVSQNVAIDVSIHLGNEMGELKFFPSNIQFESGKRYKLILDNPSPEKHYFTAKDFADVIWSQKVEAAGVEVKGAIHEIELKPGAVAEWVFIPQKPGRYELHCSIPGHAEAGMTGTITISS